MNQLLDQTIANLAYYKSAKLEFRPGITCILGSNQNARTVGASNGAGKSSFFIPLHSALGYSAPLIKGRLGIKDTFGRTSEASLTFKRGKHTYRSVRKGSKITVFRDGKDLGIRTQADALKKLEALRGLTETQFYSTVYLDSSKPHLFQMGTSAERMHFFTELFDLHDVDSIKSYCRQLMNDASSAASEVTRLESELKDLTVADTTELQERLDKMVRAQDSTQRSIRTYSTVRHRLELWERHLKHEARIAELQEKISSHTAKSLKERLRAVRDYAEAAASYTTWERRRKTLLAELRTMQEDLGNLGLAKAKAQIADMDRVADIEEPDEVQAPNADDLKVLKKVLKGEDPEDKHVKALRAKALAASAEIERATEAREKLEEHGDENDGKCPLCESKIGSGHFDTMIRSLESTIADQMEKRKKATRLAAVAQQQIDWVAYDAALREYRKKTKGYDEKRHRALKAYVKALTGYAAHKESEPPSPGEQPKDDEDRLQAQLELVTQLQSLKDQPGIASDTEAELRAFAKEHGMEFKVSLLRKFVDKADEELTVKLRKYNKEIPMLKSQVDMLKSDARRAAKLQAELEEQKKLSGDLPVLKMMVEAYSKSGIKSLMIQRLAAAVEKNLNALAPQVLREPMKFQLAVDGANFHVIATRKNMGRAKVSDVRMLSGAERRMFILLFLGATLPLLPAARRYDTLVLDEPYANLDAPNIEMLRDRLLPKLLKVVPKIVVLATHSEHVPHGARVFTATKYNDESRLLQGMPNVVKFSTDRIGGGRGSGNTPDAPNSSSRSRKLAA